MTALRDFDLRELYRVMQATRDARRLTWPELTADINSRFAQTHAIPIGVRTLRDLQVKILVTSHVGLQILRWLGRTPESFLEGNHAPPRPEEALPEPGPSLILRFDTRAMHAALEMERAKQGLTWDEVASEIPGFNAIMLRNLAAGPRSAFPRIMMIPQWLRRPAASFVRGYER
jgi:hypothetical protein